MYWQVRMPINVAHFADCEVNSDPALRYPDNVNASLRNKYAKAFDKRRSDRQNPHP